jgi:adenosylcobinamide-GDP ribazoletransferase
LHARADAERPRRPATLPGRAAAGLSAAFTLLTVLPLGRGRDLDDAAPWFPLVGAAVGLIAGAVGAAGEHLLGRTPGSVLAIAALVIVTGALHQDGLADSADALGARGDRERRLEVMRDSSIGVFGALALLGWALLFVSVLDSLSAVRALRALAVAGAVGRWAALLHAGATTTARSEGLGAGLPVGRTALVAGSATALAVALAVGEVGPGFAALGAGVLVAGPVSLHAQRTLGGRTGDTLGATIALTEVAVCAVLLALWR